ncbi:GerAB/ArcD/ProY family transporter [Heyndrickxia vini]|uniref:GerAB/ArcD/ProY family transporter n=1 Tax=Heyndrickxia vini TaxID=1476025 RepID=A0ABX7E2W4_9BACI|nr:GerAB/ArcD/ProY family transporter [Heyndrickxia vini]QQZ10066.1 GerAB/ArcD/ProY family transporter [Heyndrickxia vini]
MNRYFLYLVLINMLINVIMFVPKILIEYRFEGAVMGILIAVPISLCITFLFIKAMSKFPEQGFPEIFASSQHRLLKITCFSMMQFLWFSAGLITLLEFIDILNRFINPEFPKLMILAIYLVSICFVIQLPTDRVMYLLEIVLFINTPLIGFIIFKAYTNENISWDAILEVGTHLFEMPNLKVIGTATYVFTGFTNLIIFNRVIKKTLSNWNFVAIFLLGCVSLFTTFFIPIGFNGADQTEEFLYPWISTSDSIRMVYSPIERVIFLFLIFYMSTVLISVSVHWHVAFELMKGTFKKKSSKKQNGTVIALYVCLSIVGVTFTNTVLLNTFTSYWMVVRFIVEILFVASFFLWARRRTLSKK